MPTKVECIFNCENILKKFAHLLTHGPFFLSIENDHLKNRRCWNSIFTHANHLECTLHRQTMNSFVWIKLILKTNSNGTLNSSVRLY